MAHQTVIQISAYDPSYKGIEAVQAPIPEPGHGEVLVRMTLRPVNPADVFSALGVYPGFTPAAMPAVLGLEGTGKVAKLGPGTSGRIKEGQRVVATSWPSAVGNGTWQQYVVVSEEVLVAVPDAVSDEAAAQALVNPVPVIAMFQGLAVPKGEWVVITAAGSALGRMALSYAKTLGVRTIGTVRRKEQVQEVKDAGADEVLVLPGDNAGERIKQITGGKLAWGAIDAVAGDVPKQIAEGVRNNGTIYLYGAMNGLDVAWSVIPTLFRNITLKGMWLVPWLAEHTPEQQRAVLETSLANFVSGVFPASKGEVLPLEEAVKGLQLQAVVGRQGKVLLQG